MEVSPAGIPVFIISFRRPVIRRFTKVAAQRIFLPGATYTTAGVLQSGTDIVPVEFTANFYYSGVTGNYDLTVREIGP
ncbi:MAG: hypothetical protein WCC86_07195 [Methanoregula sp.]|uniref:hypothetical protein n=1 Tax=Methanoregula sp. TaxID=2052170 RepID=UPI003C546FD7